MEMYVAMRLERKTRIACKTRVKWGSSIGKYIFC
jgi:hypothetical protein